MKKISLFVQFILLFLLEMHAQSALDQANEAYLIGDYAKALSASDLQIQQSASAEAYFLRANCLQKLENHSKALDDYDKARQDGYAQPDLYLNRGICKISMQLFESAKADLMTFLQKNEADAKGFYWLAVAEYMAMENKACQRYVDEAIWLDTTYSEAYYLRAANYADQRKLNLAMEDFQMAYDLKPELHRAKLNMASLLMEMGLYQNAFEMLSELKLEKTGFLSEVLYFRGETLYNLHDMEGACGDWVEAAQMGDPDSESMYKKMCIDKKDKPRFKRRSYFQF